MKKIFKRSLACLIAVLMIVSSLPFTAVTANAATTTTSIGTKSYGLFTNETNSRWKGSYANVVNDSSEAAFDIGFINFDISGLNATEYDDISATYSFTVQKASNCTKYVPLHVMYPTKNQASFNVNTNVGSSEGNASKIDNTAYSNIWSNGSSNGFFKGAKSYFDLQELTSVTLSDSSSKTVSVNIGPAIKAAKSAGLSYATVAFLLAYADGSDGGAGSGSAWSDTNVYIQSTTVNVSITDITTVKQYVKNNISSFNGYTGTASAPTTNWSGNPEVANALYVSEAYSDTSSYVSKTYKNSDGQKYKFMGYKDVVLLNTTTQAYFPITFEEVGLTSYSGTAKREYDYIATTTTGFQTKDDWVECDSWNSYNAKSGGITASGDISHNNTTTGSSLGYPLMSKDKSRDFRNKVYLNQGDGNTSQYYDKYDSISFDIRLDYYYNYTEWFTNYTDTLQDQLLQGVKYEENKTVYVVNYKPIANAIQSIKNMYNTVAANGESAYCESGLNAYYIALYKVMTLNPNNYAYSSDVDAAVQKVASDIKDVVNNYLTTAKTEPTKHNKVTSRENEIAATCTKAGSYDEVTKCSICGEELSRVTKSIPATGHTAGTPTEENRVEATCTTAGSYKLVTRCTVCNEVISEETKTIDALGHNYTYEYVDKTYHTKKCTRGDVEEKEEHTLGSDGKCTVCGGTLIDYNAYNAARDIAFDIMYGTDSSNYTTESFEEYKTIVLGATQQVANVKTQEELDVLTDTIVSAQTVLRKKTVTVTLVKVNGDNNEEVIKTYEDQAYGSALEIDLATEDSSIKGVEKWTVSTDNGLTTTKLSTTDTKLTFYVTKSATIKVYELDEPTDSETVEYSKVVFLGKNSVIVAIKYVAKDKTLSTSGIDAPAIPFYTFSKWDKETVTGTGETIYVRAEYTYSEKSEDMCNVHFVGKWSKAYAYDSYVYLDEVEDGAMYALASDADGQNILTYLEGRDFYAPKTSDIYVVRVESREPKIGITGHFAGSDDTYRWATYNCKFYLPEDCTAIEWGLEVTVGNQKQLIKAESLSKGNEYTVNARVKTGSSLHSITCRSYVTYKQNGNTYTIYSDAVDQEF